MLKSSMSMLTRESWVRGEKAGREAAVSLLGFRRFRGIQEDKMSRNSWINILFLTSATFSAAGSD